MVKTCGMTFGVRFKWWVRPALSIALIMAFVLWWVIPSAKMGWLVNRFAQLIADRGLTLETGGHS